MSNLDSEFNSQDVEVLERRELHSRFLRVELLTLKHRLHEGGWLGPLQRELLVKDPAVGVLLFDPVLDKVVLVRQFRVGVMDDKHSPWILELVAGLVDKDETLEGVAGRECVEEANLEPADLFRICDYYNSPGTTDERVTLFCGRVDASTAGGVFGLSEEHEDIEVVTLSTEQAFAALGEGKLDNAMTIIALQWLQLHRNDLQARWGNT